MFPIHDHLSAATKASMEANLAMYTALTSRMLESAEELIKLNFSSTQSSLQDSMAAAKARLAAQDAQEYFSLLRAHAKPNMNKAIAYGGHFVSIVSGLHSDFGTAVEAQIAAASNKVNELVEEVTSNAPAGSETMMAVVKSVLGNSGNGYEQFTRTAKQAMEALEANLNSAISSLPHAALAKV